MSEIAAKSFPPFLPRLRTLHYGTSIWQHLVDLGCVLRRLDRACCASLKACGVDLGVWPHPCAAFCGDGGSWLPLLVGRRLEETELHRLPQ